MFPTRFLALTLIAALTLGCATAPAALQETLDMPSPDISLADEIVADLNAQNWSIDFAAERTWLPDWDQINELSELTVSVQPSPTPEGEIFERVGVQETWPIDVAFARRLNDSKDRDEIDALIAVVDEVRIHITPEDDEPRSYSAGGLAFVNRGWQFLTRFDPRQLNRENLGATIAYTGNFLSVIRFPFLRID